MKCVEYFIQFIYTKAADPSAQCDEAQPVCQRYMKSQRICYGMGAGHGCSVVHIKNSYASDLPPTIKDAPNIAKGVSDDFLRTWMFRAECLILDLAVSSMAPRQLH